MLDDPKRQVAAQIDALMRGAMETLPPPTGDLSATIRMLSDEQDIVDVFPRDSFPGTMTRLFTNRAQGIGAAHINTRLFKIFNDVASYYPYGSDITLINRHGAEYREMIRRDLPDGMRILLFELGSGKESQKTRDIISHIRPDDYAVDEADTSALLATVEMVTAQYPGMGVYPRNKDFNRENMEEWSVLSLKNQEGQAVSPYVRDISLPADSRRLMVQFGTTLGNMEGAPKGGLPTRDVLEALVNYRAHLSVGDYAILSLDQNQDQDSLNRCYGHPIHRELAEDLLQRTFSQVPHTGFDVKNFRYTRFWNPDNHLYANGFEVARDNSFIMGGVQAEWKKGDVLSYANSYKYPHWFLETLLTAAGFNIERINADDKGCMHHYVLRAVPLPVIERHAGRGHNHTI